jgi:hypothetical protein
MHRAVIFIADSNPNGPGHKMILPAIRYMYLKKGIDCRIINPYKEGWDPTATTNMGQNTFTQSYKHFIKTATHVHFITSSHLGGVSPIMEGIFEHVLVNGFAYNRVEDKREKRFKKKAFFYVMYNHNVSKFNPLWLRLKFTMLRQLFSDGKVFQFTPKDLINLKSKGVTEKLNTYFRKHFE